MIIQSYRLHNGPVNQLLLRKGVLFSGGDKRVLLSDYINGNLILQLSRSSGDITTIAEYNDEIHFSDINGALRTSMITFDPKDMLIVTILMCL